MGMWIGEETKVHSDKTGSSRRGLLRQFVEWLDARDRAPDELLGLCLERITARDEQLRAWVQVAPQPALGSGPLNGIPFGAKDIYETLGLATEYGSPLYAGRKGVSDARLITDLRKLGAVLVGKTQTTAFAYFDPAPTCNPHQPDHTPGGSSSGSAVAVAAGGGALGAGAHEVGAAVRPGSVLGGVGVCASGRLTPV